MSMAIISLYLGLIFLLAFLSRERGAGRSRPEGRYLAGRKLRFIESAGSIIATEVSALSFVGLPAFAYTTDFSLLYFYSGTLISRPLIALLVIPRIYGKGLTLFGIMGGPGETQAGRKLTALIYTVTKALGVGVRFYAGSILVASTFAVPLWVALSLIAGLTCGYTLIGGLRAVVRTDLLQMALFTAGGVSAHFIIPEAAGESWTELMERASEAGKTELFSWAKLPSFLMGFTGGILFDFCTHGFDQDYSQRVLGAKSRKTAVWAMASSSLASVSMGLLFLPIGSLLWSYYQSAPLPDGIGPDGIFPYFITTHFPESFQALMLACVLAGLAVTMSTLDSTINALSGVLWNDLHPGRDQRRLSLHFMGDTLIISLLLLGIAILSSYSEGLFVLGMSISSWSVACVGALFFSQLAWNATTRSILDGPTVLKALLSNLAGVGINTFILEGPWQWNVYYGGLAATAYLFCSGLFKAWRGQESPKL